MCSSFDQVRLGELFEITKKAICPFLFPNEEFAHHSLPAFDATGGPAIELGREIESNKTLLTEPVVLLSKLNPRISRVSVIDPRNSRRRNCCSTEFIAYRAKQRQTCIQFYGFFFQTAPFRTRLQNAAIGTTNSHVRVAPSETLTWDVPNPDPNEQVKIAEILSTVVEAIEQTEGLIAKQQRIIKGLLHDLLTRGIDEHGNLRSEQTHEFKDSSLGRIPVEWEVSPAQSLCSAVIDCKNRTPPPRTEGHPVIRTSNVRAGKFIYDDLTMTDAKSYELWTARGKPRIGDVVITREAPVGEACLIPDDLPSACLGQRIMLYQACLAKLDPRYLLFAIYSERVQRRLLELAGGSTVGHVRVGDIRELSIPHPVEVYEQSTIANVLSSMTDEQAQNSRILDKLRRTKTGLMRDLLTGDRRVTTLLPQWGSVRA